MLKLLRVHLIGWNSVLVQKKALVQKLQLCQKFPVHHSLDVDLNAAISRHPAPVMALLMHLQCWWNLSDMIHLLSFALLWWNFFVALTFCLDWLVFFRLRIRFFSINLFHLKTIWRVLFGIDNLNNLIQIQRSAFYLMGLSMARQHAPCLWPANQLLDPPRPLQIVCTWPVFNSRFNSMWASTCLIFNSQFKSLCIGPLSADFQF